jgi:hypothetical protein
MLDLHARKQLCLIIEQHGQGIMTEPKRCRGLLNDLAPQCRLENNLLMMALEQDITGQLLKPNNLIPVESQLECLAQNLHNAVGIEEDLAYWATESWALALGVISYPIPRAAQAKTDILPVSSSSVIRKVKNTRQLSFVVFFTAWMVAVIFVVMVFDLASKPKHDYKVSKPAATTQANIELPSQNEVVLERYDAWTENNLGDMYYFGHGVAKNDQKAAEYYRKAAEQDYAVGQCNLGFMYNHGYGVPLDYQKAAEWYRKAAEQGNADAQSNLGTLYENGDGVDKDMTKAVEWYSKAVEQGHFGAQQSLRRLLVKS